MRTAIIFDIPCAVAILRNSNVSISNLNVASMTSKTRPTTLAASSIDARLGPTSWNVRRLRRPEMRVTGPVIVGIERYPAETSPRLSFSLPPVSAAVRMLSTPSSGDTVHVSLGRVPSSAPHGVPMVPLSFPLPTVGTVPLSVSVLSNLEGNSTLVTPVTVPLVSRPLS